MNQKLKHLSIICLVLIASAPSWSSPGSVFKIFSGDANQSTATEAQKILLAAGIEGGLVVHLGCGEGSFTADLYQNDSFLVQGLDTNVLTARDTIKAKDLYGKVSAVQFDGEDLPYVDNLVDLVIVENGCQVPCDEVARVLAPHGVVASETGVYNSWSPSLESKNEALPNWEMASKKYPSAMDDWNQYLHGADNNAVAQDTVVGPPRHLQWTSSPVWSRSHMGIASIVSMVSCNGRLFSIEDRASRENPFLPGDFYLVAREAFNGIKLWEYKIPQWESITRYIKAMVTQQQRRLAAIGDKVYCTPGLSAPITVFDAATGEIEKIFSGTENTQEFAYHNGILYAVVGQRMNAAGSDYYDNVKLDNKGTSLGGSDASASFDGCGFDAAYTPEVTNVTAWVCDIVALDPDTGDQIWRQSNIQKYGGTSLAIRNSNLVYQTKTNLRCLNSMTGETIWNVSNTVDIKDGVKPNTVVISDDAVYASDHTSFSAYSIADGEFLWSKSIERNYENPPDIFLANGSLWTGGQGAPTEYDPLTGASKSTISQVKDGPMGHDRCYRNFITEKYFINSRTGGADFLDLSEHTELPNYWIRGTCGFGVLPCNGLLYSTPFSCSCSIGAMIQNMNAVSTEPGLSSSDDPIVVQTNNVLIEGPSYNYIDADCEATDWPTFRHDGQRSGTTTNTVSANGLTQAWEFQLPGDNPSALTIEDGKLFVSDIDRHTIYALDVTTGNKLWEYTAGGRVDSPPTFYKGLVLFGSRDGWVHCLKASDGTLSWRFKGLPDRMICAFGQLESAWPVFGSVLVENGVAYFSAGRSSFLDGGIFQYGLDPQTGDLIHQSKIYGPFSGEFPADGGYDGYKNDIFVSDGSTLYLRHKPFNLDLSAGDRDNHLLPTAGFLDGTPQHRTHWEFNNKYSSRGNDCGELLVLNDTDKWQMRGFPDNRHSYFDPRLSGYELSQVGGWSKEIPIITKAMVLAGENLFVAGNPIESLLDYDRNDPIAEAEAYVESYNNNRGSVMRVVSKNSGSTLADYTLSTNKSVVWDTLVAADGNLYMCMKDGSVVAWSN